MNYARVVAAGIAAFVVYLAYGFLVYGRLIAREYAPYPTVFRSLSDLQHYIGYGFGAAFIGFMVLAAIYAKGYEGGSGLVEGARFGLLIGIFMICTLVVHEWVILNIGNQLALAQAAAALPEWVLMGITIGLAYKPNPAPAPRST